MKRREFLKKTSLIAAGAIFSPPFHGSARSSDPNTYDIIIIGAGAAGCIVAKRLVDRFPHKSILLIEAGGPTSQEVGGTDFPPYDTRATIFDVPGEYTNMAFQPKGDPYKQKETPFTYQGMGYGGNSQFNGMLFQAAPPRDFDQDWPPGWKYDDIRPYFDLVLAEMHVSDVPSTDQLFYNDGASRIVGDIYRAHGFKEVDTRVLGGLGDRYFSRAYVVSQDGLRGGPVRTHLTSIVGSDGESTRPNLDVIRFAKVERIVFGAFDSHQAVGITYVARQSSQDLPASAPQEKFPAFLGVRVGSEPADLPAEGQGSATFVRLTEDGRIILAAGALMTPRLLLLSGVGPVQRHDEIFVDGFSVPFHIDNPGIGTSLFDHVGTGLTYEYTGSSPSFQAYHYSDYTSNEKDLAQYGAFRAGPYAQYGPVSVMQEYIDPWWTGPPLTTKQRRPLRQPNVEVFVNPAGSGAPGGPYNGPRHLSAFAMLLRPLARGLIRIDRDTFVKFPPVYLTNEHDLNLMTDAIHQLIVMYRGNPDLAIVFGPGGRSHPHLDPARFSDVKEYVGGFDPVDGIFYTRLIINHWGGTCPLRRDPHSGVDPSTLLVRGTRNIHVVDASLHPAPLSAHPVATIMAVAEKASDILSGQLGG